MKEFAKTDAESDDVADGSVGQDRSGPEESGRKT